MMNAVPIPESQIAYSDYLSNGMYAVWTKWKCNSKNGKYYANADVYRKKGDKTPVLMLRDIEKFPCAVNIDYTDMLEYLEGETSEIQVNIL